MGSPRSSAKKIKTSRKTKGELEAELAAVRKQLADTIGKPDSETEESTPNPTPTPAVTKMLKDGEEQKNKITTYQKEPPDFKSKVATTPTKNNKKKKTQNR